MPLNRVAFGDFIRGFVTRSMVDLNVDAATASLDGGEKRKPERTLNVYVVPPAVGAGIASATSGTMRDPSGAGLSGYVTKFAQVAYKICIAAPPSKSAGSSVSRSSFSVKRATPPAGGGRGGAGATATHMCPAANASASGVPPTPIVLFTFPERGSRRMTVPSRPFATHSAVGVA